MTKQLLISIKPEHDGDDRVWKQGIAYLPGVNVISYDETSLHIEIPAESEDDYFNNLEKTIRGVLLHKYGDYSDCFTIKEIK